MLASSNPSHAMSDPRIVVENNSIEMSPGEATSPLADGTESQCCGGYICPAPDGEEDLHVPLCSDAQHGAMTNASIPLYDPDSTLDISKEVAGGYLVLLTGGIMTANAVDEHKSLSGKKSRNKTKRSTSGGESSSQKSDSSLTRIPDSAIQLAFMSITDGNVIDVAFGVHTSGGMKRSMGTSSIAYNAAREAKELLREASYSSKAVSRIAVEAYEACFEIVVDYNKKIDNLGFFSRCYQREIIRGEAEDSLEEAFAILKEAVEAAT